MKKKLLFYHQVAATRVIFNLILAGGGKRKMEPELFPSESPPRSAADKTSPQLRVFVRCFCLCFHYEERELPPPPPSAARPVSVKQVEKWVKTGKRGGFFLGRAFFPDLEDIVFQFEAEEREQERRGFVAFNTKEKKWQIDTQFSGSIQVKSIKRRSSRTLI